jgi:molybdenum cofactor cytidylyltransferase
MIAAVVLAAGQSKRMGRPKMTLPWGETTVIGQVVTQIAQAGVTEIIVITGASHHEVEQALQGSPVRILFNPRYADGEMVSSLHIGLSALDESIEAALVVLGDQPQIVTTLVRDVLRTFHITEAPLVVPSYQMHRGHPWIIARSLWPAVLSLEAPQTLRDFLHTSSDKIQYVTVDTPSVLQDLDTPEDYDRYHPG